VGDDDTLKHRAGRVEAQHEIDALGHGADRLEAQRMPDAAAGYRGRAARGVARLAAWEARRERR
jgi:hypothetical protein